MRSAYLRVSGGDGRVMGLGYGDGGAPWPFWQERDVRTIVAAGWLAGATDYKQSLPFEGVPHNCVDDAAHQAKYTTKILRGLI